MIDLWANRIRIKVRQLETNCRAKSGRRDTLKFLFGFLLVIGGICGIAISLLGHTVVTSSIVLINGFELSLWLGFFSFIAFLSGMYIIFLMLSR